MLFVRTSLRNLSLFVVALYGVELLDELIYGLHGAALPYLRDEFTLTYTQIGLLTTLPGLLGLGFDPVIGLLGDTRHRRALVVGGITVTLLGLLTMGAASAYGWVLWASCALFVASGAYVNLSQATLIDRDPARAEQTMARWTLLGSIGVTAAPLLLTLVFSSAWRSAYFLAALIAALFLAALIRQRFDRHNGAHDEPAAPRVLLRQLLSALRQRTLLKWLLLTELADLMLDKLLEVTGLYFRDVVGVSLAGASAAVAVSTIAGLIGGVVIVPVLERMPGLRLLRLSALIVLIAYVTMLIAPGVGLKYALIALVSFATAGWYAILRAKCFEALPGQSGTMIAVTSLANLSSLFVPVLIGGVADAAGLEVAMWILALGPVALIIGLR